MRVSVFFNTRGLVCMQHVRIVVVYKNLNLTGTLPPVPWVIRAGGMFTGVDCSGRLGKLMSRSRICSLERVEISLKVSSCKCALDTKELQVS